MSSHSRCNVHVSASLNSVREKEPQWKGQDICALLEASYLSIYLFLLIINLDYSRHLKRGNNNSEAAGRRKRVDSTGRLKNNRSGIC